MIARALWDLSGFRFKLAKQTQTVDGFSLFFHCCQDQAQQAKSSGKGLRDAETGIAEHQCHSRLKLHLKPVSRLLSFSLRHTSHAPYSDRTVPSSVIEFIEGRTDSTAGQIFQDMRAILGAETAAVTQKQVYYWWQRLSSTIWRLHNDPFQSAMQAIQSSANADPTAAISASVSAHLIRREGKTAGMAIVAEGIVQALAPTTVELSIDATFGTNNAGHELFGVLAELDGTGVPLLYCLMDTRELTEAGKKIHVIVEVLRLLKDRGLRPRFVGCDKDSSEIAAIAAVWPESRTQLCFWHVLRAIRQRLASSKATSTKLYRPQDAACVVPAVEICWGSSGPNKHHPPQICTCSSLGDRWASPGKLECAKDESKVVIDLVSRHFNEHTSFPTLLGTHLSMHEIHRRQAQEAYAVCKARGWARVWAYLWTNWYDMKEWKLWARAANESVPILKSTMVTESHWRVIKHDYLHRFARPRVDLVVHVLRTRVIPTAAMRVTALQTGNIRVARPSWRADFVKRWRGNETDEVSDEAIERYHTDVHAWTCACHAFAGSRFLLCKHLISLVPPMTTLELRKMQRNRDPPYWTYLLGSLPYAPPI